MDKKQLPNLTCSMVRGCIDPVTHLDCKGYTYCAKHAVRRKAGGISTRKIRAGEMQKLREEKEAWGG